MQPELSARFELLSVQNIFNTIVICEICKATQHSKDTQFLEFGQPCNKLQLRRLQCALTIGDVKELPIRAALLHDTSDSIILARRHLSGPCQNAADQECVVSIHSLHESSSEPLSERQGT